MRLSSTEIAVSWTSDFQRCDGYRIERSVNGGTWTELANLDIWQVNYFDTSVNATDQYDYRLIAKNTMLGDSQPSDPSSKNDSSTVWPDEDPANMGNAVMVEVTNGGNTQAMFNGGANLPAGHYKIMYHSGSWNQHYLTYLFNDDPWGWGHAINDDYNDATLGFSLVGGPGGSLPGIGLQFASHNELGMVYSYESIDNPVGADTLSRGMSMEFDFAGGPLGVKFDSPLPGAMDLGVHGSLNGFHDMLYYSGAVMWSLAAVTGDLDVTKVEHNASNGELPENEEDTVGAFVPVNNDDDEYDHYDPANNKSDLDQTGVLAAPDDDLLEIKLHPAQGATVINGDYYTLTIPSNVKVWWAQDKGNNGEWGSGQVLDDTAIDATQTTISLWVEGVSAGTGEIVLNLHHGANTLANLDRIKVTTFVMTGPLNVPGYSVYEYTAAGAPAGGKWIDPTGGTVKSGANSNDISILWGQGADVEKAVYQANANYKWDLEVNVVKITATAGAITVPTAPPIANSLPQDGNGAFHSDFVAISVNGNIDFKTSVTVQGADAAGDRGVKFIRIGFIQEWVSASASHALYFMGLNQYGEPEYKRRTSATEGMANVLDTWDGSLKPWYKSYDGQAGWSPTPANLSHDFETTDSPELWFPKTSDGTVNGGALNEADLEWSFSMYLAVETIEGINSSENVFTPRMKADWSVNYDGIFSGTTFTPNSGSKMSGPTVFTASPSDGTPVPVAPISGSIFNDEITTVRLQVEQVQ
ncbi:MAG TPA: hypothetical protein VHD56_13245 [Tepidisphaeraceae bacterium]|nr:hypothetical protein [Tepidisphaeraceae bacterium]